MLLRSSSTPVLGSLLTSISDSPNNNHHHQNHPQTPPNTIHHIHNKLPKFHQTAGSFNLNLAFLSSNSSPISPSINAEFSGKGFRRAQSEGNLEGLAYASCNINNDEFYNSNQTQKFSSRPQSSLLETIPSFTFYNSRRICEDNKEEEEESDEEGEFEDTDDELLMERFVEGGQEKVMAMGGGEKMELVEEKGFKIDFGNVGYEEGRERVSTEMYLARGLGVSGGGGFFGGGGGGGSDFTPGDSSGDGGMEEYYRRMVDENPCNPLFLRNYAQFLYESKRDLHGAEEYYSRAILADPKDGEILSQYAKIVWELHRDKDRASSYFERAVQAAPEDSHIVAAYASFLWETEEDEDEESAAKDFNDAVVSLFHKEAMASARA